MDVGEDRAGSAAERRVFAHWLRHGTPLGDVDEVKRRSGFYVWRTRQDERVRSSHARNDGKIFSFDSPPPTGNPGEDHNCRCTAVAYVPGVTEYAAHALDGVSGESRERWGIVDFVGHFYFGGGVGKTLREVGHLSEVVEQHAFLDRGEGALRRLSDQIADEARLIGGSGPIAYFGDQDYDFGAVSFVHGLSNVAYAFRGATRRVGSMMRIEGRTTFTLSDTFTDPVDARQRYERETGETIDPKGWFHR